MQDNNKIYSYFLLFFIGIAVLCFIDSIAPYTDATQRIFALIAGIVILSAVELTISGIVLKALFWDYDIKERKI